MIDHLLQPLACESFLTDARYREGHLRVVNALPERRVVGLHSPEIKQVAKQLSREGGEVAQFPQKVVTFFAEVESWSRLALFVWDWNSRVRRVAKGYNL